jgi:hypothetical protein
VPIVGLGWDFPRKLHWDKTFRLTEKKREATHLPTRGEEDGSICLKHRSRSASCACQLPVYNILQITCASSVVGIPGTVYKIIRDFTHVNIINNIMKAFPEVKRPGRGADHPPNLVPRLKKEYCHASGHSWPVLGWIVHFLFHIIIANARNLPILHYASEDGRKVRFFLIKQNKIVQNCGRTLLLSPQL